MVEIQGFPSPEQTEPVILKIREEGRESLRGGGGALRGQRSEVGNPGSDVVRSKRRGVKLAGQGPGGVKLQRESIMATPQRWGRLTGANAFGERAPLGGRNPGSASRVGQDHVIKPLVGEVPEVANTMG
jgi:hypothetical protein